MPEPAEFLQVEAREGQEVRTSGVQLISYLECTGILQTLVSMQHVFLLQLRNVPLW